MLRGELRCNDHDYEKIAERLFEINKDLELLSDDIEKFSIREMAKLVIPENLKYQAKLKFVNKGGKNLRDEEEIIDLCRDIKEVLNIERQKDRFYNHHHSTSNQISAEERERCDSAPCQKHNGVHKWKDCPDNWHNKSTTANDNPSASNSTSRTRGGKGEVHITEKVIHSDSPMVTFDEVEADDESATSSIISRGELMNIVSTTTSNKKLHPITILTLLDKNQHRVACTTLMDECCTDNGIISWKLSKVLDLPIHNTTPKTFTTAAGTFTTDQTIKLTNAMLPCLSTSETFTLEVMVIPKECSSGISYGAIIGQDSMRTLDIDTSVCHNTISWHNNSISMVTRDFWTAERILQQKSKLSKKLSQPKIEVADDEIIEAKELGSNNINTTQVYHTDLTINSPIQLKVAREQYKIASEDKPLKQDYSTLPTTADNKTQAMNMGDKSDKQFDSGTTTHVQSYFNTQRNAYEMPTTYPSNKTWHIIRASLNNKPTLPPNIDNNNMEQMTNATTPPDIMNSITNEHKLPMT